MEVDPILGDETYLASRKRRKQATVDCGVENAPAIPAVRDKPNRGEELPIDQHTRSALEHMVDHRLFGEGARVRPPWFRFEARRCADALPSSLDDASLFVFVRDPLEQRDIHPKHQDVNLLERFNLRWQRALRVLNDEKPCADINRNGTWDRSPMEQEESTLAEN